MRDAFSSRWSHPAFDGSDLSLKNLKAWFTLLFVAGISYKMMLTRESSCLWCRQRHTEWKRQRFATCSCCVLTVGVERVTLFLVAAVSCWTMRRQQHWCWKGESPYFWWQGCHAEPCEDNGIDVETTETMLTNNVKRGVTLFLMAAVSCWAVWTQQTWYWKVSHLVSNGSSTAWRQQKWLWKKGHLVSDGRDIMLSVGEDNRNSIKTVKRVKKG